MPRLPINSKKRPLEDDNQESINDAESRKQTKPNTKDEEKEAQQSNLAGFFGITRQPSAKF